MDDAVSLWILNHWYELHHNHKNAVIACVLARHFNQPLTLARIGFPKVYNEGYVQSSLEKIESLKRNEETVFNGAYIIRASGEYPNKSEMVFYETVQQFVDKPLRNYGETMEKTVEQLMQYRNIGSFMAGQIAADLRWATDRPFSDKLKWAAMGPGSKRGMNRIQNRPLDFNLKQEQFTKELRELVTFLVKALPSSLTDRLEMIDYQNCLCELDKFERILWGEGRPKAKYQGMS